MSLNVNFELDPNSATSDTSTNINTGTGVPTAATPSVTGMVNTSNKTNAFYKKHEFPDHKFIHISCQKLADAMELKGTVKCSADDLKWFQAFKQCKNVCTDCTKCSKGINGIVFITPAQAKDVGIL